MRFLTARLALLLAACPALRAADVAFIRVWPQWHNSDSFQSLYEDRTGHEITGRWIVIRSQPDNRSGLYFLTRIENPGPPIRGATFVLRIIAPDSTDTRVYNFSADVPSGSRLFEIGLTGTDWAGQRVEPVAWDVELRAADGRLVARKTSFLWEMPER